jgi:hypothetical protein
MHNAVLSDTQLTDRRPASNDGPAAAHPAPGPRPGHSVRTAALACLLLGACATHYDLTLMPRNHGTLLHGTADGLGNGEAKVVVGMGERTYTGNWVQVTPETQTTFVGASAWGWGGWGAWGPYGAIDRSVGSAVAKALLQAPDGSGLRCDFYGLTGGQGTGRCIDDQGLNYDVQIRTRKTP